MHQLWLLQALVLLVLWKNKVARVIMSWIMEFYWEGAGGMSKKLYELL